MANDDDDIRDRFRRVAIDLFRKKGFDRTTAAEIARGAGVTERTFFRYYPDKRDVLFEGEALVRTLLIAAISSAPAELGVLDTMRRAIGVLTPVLEAFRPYAQARHALVHATPSLEEREIARAAALGQTLARSLQRRGVEPAVAAMTSHAALAVLTLAGTRWLQEDDTPLAGVVDDVFADLCTVLASLS